MTPRDLAPQTDADRPDGVDGILLPPGAPVACGLCGTVTECCPLGELAAAGPAHATSLRVCADCLHLTGSNPTAFWAQFHARYPKL